VQQQHIFIGCAAVADYRAETVAHEKIKKQATQGVYGCWYSFC